MLPFESVTRDILTRRKYKTDPKFGCAPEKRSIAQHILYGVVNIDKPRGPTSHQVSSYVKDILHVSKCGHSGTLDPHVTGVLPVAVGRATRVVQLLLTAGKEYVGVMHLHKDAPDADLEAARQKFLGKINQLPPVKSAVKREVRERSVYRFELMEREDKNVLFKVSCQAGTYIRKLIHDLGLQIGGAHMAELRRTQAGPFHEDTLITLQDLKDAYYYYKEENREEPLRKALQTMESAVAHLPKIWVQDSSVESLCHGANLNVPGIARLHNGIREGNIVAVMTLKDELICYGTTRATSKDMLGEKGFAVKVEKVFMEPGTYPRMPKEEPAGKKEKTGRPFRPQHPFAQRKQRRPSSVKKNMLT